jgi:hypothetical protein
MIHLEFTYIVTKKNTNVIMANASSTIGKILLKKIRIKINYI